MNDIKVLVIEPNKVPYLKTLDRSDLQGFQRLVGGWVENITLLLDGTSMFINEEGKLNGLPLNPVATAMVEKFIPGFIKQDVIVGTAVILGANNEHSASCPQHIIDTVESLVGSVPKE